MFTGFTASPLPVRVFDALLDRSAQDDSRLSDSPVRHARWLRYSPDCSSRPCDLPLPSGSTLRTRYVSAGSSSAGATPQSQVASVDLTRSSAAGGAALLAAPSQRVVYFDFDSFAIKDEYRALIEGHSKVLSANRDRRMVIEGHADERGGREYNLALGQKRAEAVLRTMTLLGAADQQLEAVSYGEERPAAAGSDEAAWAKNRRAELKDR